MPQPIVTTFLLAALVIAVLGEPVGAYVLVTLGVVLELYKFILLGTEPTKVPSAEEIAEAIGTLPEKEA